MCCLVSALNVDDLSTTDNFEIVSREDDRMSEDNRRGSRPATPGMAALKNQLNEALEAGIKASRSSYYEKVTVMLFYWEEKEIEGIPVSFRTEAEEVSEMFRRHFNYKTEMHAIPIDESSPDRGQHFVEFAISKFLYEENQRTHFLIIYYGGHAVDRPQHRLVWSA